MAGGGHEHTCKQIATSQDMHAILYTYECKSSRLFIKCQMALSIVLCNLKKITLNLKHFKVCVTSFHVSSTIFPQLKTTKPQFRSHSFFSYSFLQLYRIHEHKCYLMESLWVIMYVTYFIHKNAAYLMDVDICLHVSACPHQYRIT